jgi:hypothetical protein
MRPLDADGPGLAVLILNVARDTRSLDATDESVAGAL